MRFLFVSSTTGQLCSAKTWASICAMIVLFKFLVADLTLFGITFSDFDSTGASVLMGVFLLGYTKRESDKASHTEIT